MDNHTTDSVETKCCVYCKKDKPLVVFRITAKGGGRRYRAAYCNPCGNRKTHERKMRSPLGRLKRSLRCRLFFALKGKDKSQSTEALLGCSWIEARKHIESLFTEGMSWDNYGAWHVDHVRPCASFDLSLDENQRLCFHYTNLQPLWAEDNLAKADNYIV